MKDQFLGGGRRLPTRGKLCRANSFHQAKQRFSFAFADDVSVVLLPVMRSLRCVMVAPSFVASLVWHALQRKRSDTQSFGTSSINAQSLQGKVRRPRKFSGQAL